MPGGGGFTFAAFGEPQISNDDVVFRADGVDASSNVLAGVYATNGGSLFAVADTNTSIPGGSGNFINSFGAPWISDGNVAFTGRGSAGQSGIYYLPSTGVLQEVISLFDILDGKMLLDFRVGDLDGSSLAFVASFTDGSQGIFLAEATPVEGIDVPEPGTLTLLALGLLGVGFAKKRRIQ